MNRTTARHTAASRVSGWRKSTRSADSGNGNCVEARAAEAGFEIRDSKLNDESPIFGLSVTDFNGLVSGIKAHRVS